VSRWCVRCSGWWGGHGISAFDHLSVAGKGLVHGDEKDVRVRQ
jgi:hypothetical protein